MVYVCVWLWLLCARVIVCCCSLQGNTGLDDSQGELLITMLEANTTIIFLS